jgi:molybdopterin synthase sulfur carrier subunit
MVKIEFLGPIGKVPLEVDIKNLGELSDILKNDVQVSSWLKTCAVAVNDIIVKNRDISLKDGDKVSLLPPVCGG